MNSYNFTKVMRWMRNHKKVVIFVITVILIAILASCMGGNHTDATLAVGMLIGGLEDGKHVVDGPLTTDLTREGSPELLLNEIDQQIVKIRPHVHAHRPDFALWRQQARRQHGSRFLQRRGDDTHKQQGEDGFYSE